MLVKGIDSGTLCVRGAQWEDVGRRRGSEEGPDECNWRTGRLGSTKDQRYRPRVGTGDVDVEETPKGPGKRRVPKLTC